MHLFLTSSPCDDNVPAGCSLPCIFDVRNRFVEHLQACFAPDCAGVIIAASPDEHDLNDEMARTFEDCFAYHGMKLTGMTLIDSRNPEALPRAIASSGVVILGGGHVPTQNAFFRRLGLKALLQNFHGLVMGISAGTMNCASTVYAQPEMPGESIDPAYERFIPGLGLTEVNVLPHYQQVKDYTLDGRRLFEDITFADSRGRCFFALPDGSYVYNNTIWGEAYRIADGKIEQVGWEGTSFQPSNQKE